MNARALSKVGILLLLFAVGGPVQLSAEGEDPAQAKEEALAIIVNTNNPIESVTFEELRKLCLAERKHWPNGRKVTMALREPGQAEREAVLAKVCHMNESEF